MAEPGGIEEKETKPTVTPPEKPHRIKNLVRRGTATATGIATLAAGALGIGVAGKLGYEGAKAAGIIKEGEAPATKVPIQDLLLKPGEGPEKWDANANQQISTEGYLVRINPPDRVGLSDVHTFALFPQLPDSINPEMSFEDFKDGANRGDFLPVYFTTHGALGDAISPPEYHTPDLNPFSHHGGGKLLDYPPAGDAFVEIKGTFSAGKPGESLRQAELSAPSEKNNPRINEDVPVPISFEQLLANDENFYLRGVQTNGYLKFVGLSDSSYPSFDKDGKQVTHTRIKAVYALYDHTVNQADIPQTIDELSDAAGKRELVIVTEITERDSAPDDKLRADITANAQEHDGWVNIQGAMGRWLTNGLAEDNPPPIDHADVIRRSSASIEISGGGYFGKGKIDPIPAPPGR